MRIKIVRSLGTGLVKQLGLKFEDKYEEGTVHDVDDQVADSLIKQGLAETTTDPITATIKAVPKAPDIRGVPAAGSVEKATEDLERFRDTGTTKK